MRWPFGRKSTPTDQATAPGSGPGTPPASARPHDAWRSLPAVQRTIGRPPVVAPAAPFAARLATRQSPDLALAPLGHEVSPLASPGVLIGLVTSTAAANTGRVDLPVQRHAAEGHGLAVESPGWSQFDEAEDEITTGRGGTVEAGVPAAAPAASSGPGATTVPATIVAAVQRLATPAPILTASSSATVAPPPAGTLDLRPRPVGVSQPPIPATATVAQRAMAGPSPAMPTVREAAQPVRRPTLGQARRLGLGAPLPIGPDGSVQRLAATADAPLPEIGPIASPGGVGRPAGEESGNPRAIASGPVTTPAGFQESTDSPADPGLAPAAVGPLQLTVVRPLSIQRLGSSPNTSSAPERSNQAPGLALDASPTAGAPRDLIVQRLPVGVFEPSSGDQPAAGQVGEVAADHDLATVGPASIVAEPVGRMAIRASSAGSLLDPPPPVGRPGAAATVARQPAAAAGQPVVARAVADPWRSSSAVAPSTAFPPGRSTSVQREPVGPVVPRSPAGTSIAVDQLGWQGSPGSTAGSPTVQRAVEVRELVITTQVDNRGPAGEPAGGASPGAAASPAPAGAPPSIADRDRELDELARRLYGRIRTKLAAELLADRERAGLLVDLR